MFSHHEVLLRSAKSSVYVLNNAIAFVHVLSCCAHENMTAKRDNTENSAIELGRPILAWRQCKTHVRDGAKIIA